MLSANELEKLADDLSAEQLEKFKMVIDTIVLKFESENNYDNLLTPISITVPHKYFPSSIEPFEINQIIYKLVNDFQVATFKKSLPNNWLTKTANNTDYFAITIEFLIVSYYANFLKLRKIIDGKYSKLVSSNKKEFNNESNGDDRKKEIENKNNSSLSQPIFLSKIRRFPEKINSGTQWKNITIAFIDNRNIVIHVNGIKHVTDYEEMGFAKGKKFQTPTATWEFLEVLAKNNGELVVGDSDAKPKFKKQKELLSKAFQFYFRKEEDPFFPYERSPEKHNRSYKARFGLFYQQKKKEDPFRDLDSFRNEQSPTM